MKFTLRGLKIGNLIITTKNQLENTPIELNEKDIIKIFQELKKEFAFGEKEGTNGSTSEDKTAQ